MNFYSEVERVYSDWNYGHVKVIYGFLRSLKPDVHVDCGTYRGLSASWAAKAMRENGKGRVVCLDNFSLKEHVERYGDPIAHLESNLNALGVRDLIEVRQGETTNPALWPEKVDTCYVDAFHSYAAAKSDFMMAVSRGAYFIALDDTENCVGPRMLIDEFRADKKMVAEWDVMEVHADNGLTMFLKKQQRRPITFSQELPGHPGVDLRPLTLAQQNDHWNQASLITGLDYSVIADQTEHDMKL